MYNYLDEPDASMKGGDPGIRLTEPKEGIKNIYFKQGPKILDLEKDELQIVPVYQIFGSEELSSVSPSVLRRIPEPFVLMNENDAELIKTTEGDYVQLVTLKIQLKLKVKIEYSLTRGLAGLSVNLPGMPFIDLPCRGKFHKL
jgi:NADH-quinone oxidoreductase subunit G